LTLQGLPKKAMVPSATELVIAEQLCCGRALQRRSQWIACTDKICASWNIVFAQTARYRSHLAKPNGRNIVARLQFGDMRGIASSYRRPELVVCGRVAVTSVFCAWLRTANRLWALCIREIGPASSSDVRPLKSLSRAGACHSNPRGSRGFEWCRDLAGPGPRRGPESDSWRCACAFQLYLSKMVTGCSGTPSCR